MSETTKTGRLATEKIIWKYLFLFYALSFFISAPINSFYFISKWSKLTEGTIFYKMPFLLAGIGTLTAELIALSVDKKTVRNITLFGNNRVKSIVMALIPLVIITIVGMPNNLNVNEHLYAFLISAIVFVYAFTEEIFWRGYIINVLMPLGWIKNYLLVGLLWWAWHFNFSTYGLTTFLAMILGSSFLIGKFTEGTKSYLTSAGLHSLIVILTIGDNSKTLLFVAGFIILLWGIIDKFWVIKLKNNTLEIK